MQLNQSVEYVSYFASLGAGAIVVWVVWRITDPAMASTQASVEGELATRSTGWFDALVNNLPLVFLGIASIGAISAVVFRSNFVR